MAVQLGWDPSKVSNIETGKARPTEVDLAQYLATCGKGIEFLQDFADRYRHAFDLCFAQSPGNLRTLTMVENMATKIFAYEILLIPGLLQTEAYARALFMEAGIETLEAIEKGVEKRMERQCIWRRPYRPESVFYVHELALRLQVGDAQTMEDQYLRLLFNADLVRIVPANAVSLALKTPLSLFEFGKASPLAYTETDLANVFAQDAAAITESRKLFERLDAIALNAEESRSMLAAYVSGLREDLHGHGTDLA